MTRLGNPFSDGLLLTPTSTIGGPTQSIPRLGSIFSTGVPVPSGKPTIQSVEQPGFEFVFGFIPTVNFGNIFGVKDDTTRTLMNIFLDPIGIGLTLATGGLGGAGKVAKAATLFNRSQGILKTLKGSTTAVRVSDARKLLVAAAKIEKAPEIQRAMKAAVDAKDSLKFLKEARKLHKVKLDPDVLKAFPTKDELFKLDDVIRAEKGAGKLVQDVAALAPSRVLQAERGQRNLLALKIPGTQIYKPLIKGRPVWELLDSIRPLGKELTPQLIAKLQKLGIAAGATDEMISGLLHSKGVAMEEAAQVARNFKAEALKVMENIAPGSSEALPTLQTFLREKSGIPAEIIEKLGLKGAMDDIGAKTSQFGDAVVYSRNDLERLVRSKGWGKASEKLNDSLDKHFETLRNFVNDADVGVEIPYIEKYITHLWDIAPDQAKIIASKWSRSAVFKNKRKFTQAIDGLSKGHRLKFTDSLDIAEQYQLISSRLVQNSQVLKTLTDPRSHILVDGHKVPLMASEKLLDKFGIKDQYTLLTNEKARKILGKSAKAFKGNGDVARLSVPKSIWIPKEMAKGIDVMFGDPFTNGAAKFVDRFNATSKGLSLASSFFHSAALIESSMASLGIGKGLKKSAQLGFGVPFMSKLMKKVGLGIDEVRLFEEVGSDALAAGLKIQKPSDVQFDLLVDTLSKAEGAVSKVPGASKIVGLGKEYTKLMNKALWDDFHSPMKLVAYQNRLKAAIKANPNTPLSQVKRDVASFVNDAFGGQNWEQLMVSPKFKQMLHWSLLAPDWTISNARIAGLGTTGLKGTARGIFGKGRDAKEQLVGAYWRRAMPAFFASAAILNKTLSGKWPWENAPNHMWDIDTGDKDEKGRTQYIKLGKQFREPLRWLSEPWKIGGAKLAPEIQTLVEQFTGHSGSGFPTDFAKSRQPVPLTVMEEVPLRLKALVEKFIPFSFQGNSYMMAFPKSTFNNTDAIRAVSDAIKDGDGKGVLEILQLAKVSGLNLRFIKTQVQRGTGDPRGFMGQVK